MVFREGNGVCVARFAVQGPSRRLLPFRQRHASGARQQAKAAAHHDAEKSGSTWDELTGDAAFEPPLSLRSCRHVGWGRSPADMSGDDSGTWTWKQPIRRSLAAVLV